MPNSDDIRWFKQTFGGPIAVALRGSPFTVDMIVALACQETGEIWSVLRRRPLTVPQILALCVGDTIDYGGPGKGRQAFPRNKAHLLSAPQGNAMFAIARQALINMAAYVPGYQKVAANPDKFCHGFGLFQRDLQFFAVDPDYFLQRRYENFLDTLNHCFAELRRGLQTLGYQTKRLLTDVEFAQVAIAYNTGKYKPALGLKQGYFSGGRYYGEWVFDYVRQSRAVVVGGPHRVIARDGLRLRGGPGVDYAVQTTLPSGTRVMVADAGARHPDWVKVDLEGDGRLDGYVFAAFLAPDADGEADAVFGEDVVEPV